MELHLKQQPPQGAFRAPGGPEFYLWCRAGEVRAAALRDAIARGWKLYERARQGGDPYQALYY